MLRVPAPIPAPVGFGEDGTIWRAQFDLFPSHQLIIPDLPGCGGSEIIEDISMEGLAEVVKAIFTDAVKDGKAVLIGHSMGGYVALAFSKIFPGLLNAFGLFHSTAFADIEEKKETRRKGIEFIQKHSGPEFLKTTKMRRVLRRGCVNIFPKLCSGSPN